MRRETAIWTVVTAALASVAVWITVVWIQIPSVPGHPDSAFYVEMARTIAGEGRMTVDYLWHFLIHHDSIRHYAFDYWQPGVSLYQAIFVVLGLKPVQAAGVAALTLVVGLTVVTYRVPDQIGGESPPILAYCFSFLAFACGIMGPHEAFQTSIYNLLLVFAALTLLATYVADRSRPPLLASFGVAGLAWWFRNDAVLLFPLLLLTVVLREPRTDRWKSVLLGVGVYAAVVTPLLALHLFNGGFLLPPTTRTLLLIEYPDLFAYHHLDFTTYLERTDLAEIVGARIGALGDNLRRLLLRPLVATGLVASLFLGWQVRRGNGRWDGATITLVLIGAYVILQTLAYSFALPLFYFGFEKATAPITAVFAFLAIVRLAQSSCMRRLILGALVLLAAFGVRQTALNQLVAEELQHRGDRYELSCQKMADNVDTPIVMTRQVWEAHYVCPVPMVQVPSDGIEAITDVISKYSVNLLLMERWWLHARAGTEKIFRSTTYSTAGLVFTRIWVSDDGEMALYLVSSSLRDQEILVEPNLGTQSIDVPPEVGREPLPHLEAGTPASAVSPDGR